MYQNSKFLRLKSSAFCGDMFCQFTGGGGVGCGNEIQVAGHQKIISITVITRKLKIKNKKSPKQWKIKENNVQTGKNNTTVPKTITPTTL